MIKTLYKMYQDWSADGSVYLYSDPHFGDPDCKLMDPDWPDPDEHVAMLNKQLTKNDTLVILGDVGDPSYVSKLRAGGKILIMGNHDTGKSNYERRIRPYDYEFPTREDARKALKEGAITGFLFHPDVNGVYIGIVDNGLFDEIYEGPVFISEKIVLSHEPICVTAGLTGESVAFNIHGHDHSGEGCRDEYHLNVCSNVNGWRLTSLNDVIKGGLSGKVKSIHRTTIDEATARKAKREVEQ